jgi:hypothetical protein
VNKLGAVNAGFDLISDMYLIFWFDLFVGKCLTIAKAITMDWVMLRYEINQQNRISNLCTDQANKLLKVDQFHLLELPIFTAKQSTC